MIVIVAAGLSLAFKLLNSKSGSSDLFYEMQLIKCYSSIHSRIILSISEKTYCLAGYLGFSCFKPKSITFKGRV